MATKLLRSSAAVGLMTALSRVLGFLRDVTIAHTFGAVPQVDAYIVAFRLPNLLRRLFAEGAFAQAFVPVLADFRNGDDRLAERQFLHNVSGHMLFWLTLVTLMGIAGAPLITLAVAPGFAQDTHLLALAVDLVRITFPYLMFIALVAFAAGVLNTHGSFAAPAFAPVLLNICIIAAALWLAPAIEPPITALAWGVIAGGAAQLGFLVLVLAQRDLLPRPRLARPDAGTRKLWRLMLPAVVGTAVNQLGLMINTIMASFLAPGSVSWLYYADRLMEFPLGIFSLAIATVALPSLARAHAGARTEDFSALLDWSLRWILLITLPAAIALALLAEPLLSTLFHYGRFHAHDVAMTAQSLIAYAPALVGLSLVKILAPAFYARQDTRTPVRIGLLALASNTLINLGLAPWLGHAGLALGTSGAALVNAAALYFLLRSQHIYQPDACWQPLLVRIFVGCGCLSLVLLLCRGEPHLWLTYAVHERVLRLGLTVVGGLVAYFATLRLLGLRWAHMTAPAATV